MSEDFDTGLTPREKKSMKEKVKGALGGLLGGRKHHGGSMDDSKYYDATGSRENASRENVYGGATTGIETDGMLHNEAGRCSLGPGSRGTGPQSIVGKFESSFGIRRSTDRGKPKVDNSYEAWINEGKPQGWVGGSQQERTMAAALDGGTGAAKPKLGTEAVYGDAVDDEFPSREAGIMDKLKDMVTGQDSSHGIASGTATIDGPGIAGSGLQNSTVQDQDVRIGAPLHGDLGQDPSHDIASGTARIRGPGIAGSGLQSSAVQEQDVGIGAPWPESSGVLQDQKTHHNPASNQYVLDGQNADEVDRLRNVVG